MDDLNKLDSNNDNNIQPNPLEPNNNGYQQPNPYDQNGTPYQQPNPNTQNCNAYQQPNPYAQNGNAYQQPSPYAQNGNPYQQPNPYVQNGNPYQQTNPYAQNDNVYQQSNPYAQPAFQNNYYQGQPMNGQPNNNSKTLAIVSMLSGILSILTWAFVYPPFLLGIAGLITGIINNAKKKNGKGMAIAGIICSIAGLVFVIALIIFSMWIISYAAESSGFSFNEIISNPDILEQYMYDMLG